MLAVCIACHAWVRPALTARAAARHRSPRCAEKPNAGAAQLELDRLAEALPFLSDDIMAEDIVYSGLGLTFEGRAAYAAAASSWSRTLPERLRSWACTSKTVLPPDARRRVSARYSLEFEAPVPPQVLPAQRARLLAAKLPTSGLVPVRATVVGTLELDAEGRGVHAHPTAGPDAKA